MGTRIRWAFHALDHSKVGTVEEVSTEDVPWLIQCGNAVLADPEPMPAQETQTAVAPPVIPAQAKPAVPAQAGPPLDADPDAGPRAKRD